VSPARLFLLVRVYVAVLVASCLALMLAMDVDDAATEPLYSIVTVWQHGVRGERGLMKPGERVPVPGGPEKTVVIEDVVDTGPLPFASRPIFSMSFVPGRDGVEATYRGRTARATADDLLKLGAYDRPVPLAGVPFRPSVNADQVMALLAHELGTTPPELRANGRFRRLVMRKRQAPRQMPEVTKESLRASAIAAGRYLARNVLPDGSYRYEIDAVTAAETPDYNWPRHSGATWYLSDIAAYTESAELVEPARRAARHLVEHALVDCGKEHCIAAVERADLGSSALGLLAFVELHEAGFAPELAVPIRQLADFILSMQRPDGEFMHFYDRPSRTRIDVQVPYYSGEASFALGRAARVLGDRRYLESAQRALERLVDPPFWFVGWRYFFGSEHWTCHAMNELWSRAPNPKALDFCLRWQESVRDLAIEGREAAPELDSATSAGPLAMPMLTGTSSRLEAGVSTLDAARRAGADARELERLETGIRRNLAFLMRFQLTPGPHHLMPLPGRMHGGVPASPVDLKVRIDYPQHAGTAILHYLRLLEEREHGGGSRAVNP
jgi:hypothetical protein